MKIQIQITEIDNGWIVTLPPSNPVIHTKDGGQPNPQPDMFYCKTMSDVNTCLNEFQQSRKDD